MEYAARKAPLLVNIALSWVGILFLGGVGVWWLFDGTEFGRRFAEVKPEEVLTLVVERTTPRPKSYGGGARAYGKVIETGDVAEVGIYTSQFESLAPGNRLQVLRLGQGRAEYASRREYESATPLIRLGDVVVSWHFPAGIVMLLIAFALVGSVTGPMLRVLEKERRKVPR